MMVNKGFILAGLASSEGKSTVSMGIMRALKNRGLKLAPFKAGPDFIDPQFHEKAVGTPSYNLDAFLLEEETILKLYGKHSSGMDLSVVEGVMGLFDGLGKTDRASTAHLARILGLPVVLVVRARGISRSIVPLISGFLHFDPQVEIAGVIFNRVSSLAYYRLLEEMVTEELKLPCLGFLPEDSRFGLPSRHLGLIPANEGNTEGVIAAVGESAEQHINLEALMELKGKRQFFSFSPKGMKRKRLTVAYAFDRAFSFYYRDNLELLQEEGVNLIPFSPLSNSWLPRGVDAFYLGGGFPEVFASQLSANRSLLEEIRTEAERGLPIYAECGGMMLLSRCIVDLEGKVYPMAGFIPGDCLMTEKLSNFGYVNISWKGIEFRAHEFHYSRLDGIEEKEMVYNIEKPCGHRSWRGGIKIKNVLAGYPHIHFYSNPLFFMEVLNLFASSNGKTERSENK